MTTYLEPVDAPRRRGIRRKEEEEKGTWRDMFGKAEGIVIPCRVANPPGWSFDFTDLEDSQTGRYDIKKLNLKNAYI